MCPSKIVRKGGRKGRKLHAKRRDDAGSVGESEGQILKRAVHKKTTSTWTGTITRENRMVAS